MATKFENMIQQYHAHKVLLDTIQKDVASVVLPVIKALGIYQDIRWVEIEDVHIVGSWVVVDFGDSNSSIPLYIFTSEDPIKEAIQLKKEQGK